MSASAFVLLALLLVPAQIDVGRESYDVYLCPVHRDEQATGPSRCPVCNREMVERILVPSYSCPMHAQIDEQEGGECPICHMALVPTTRELQFYCPGSPDLVKSLPGTCPDGTPMQMRSVPMAHGDHNPKHGGMLFMAPNGFHHVEGTLDADGTFRLYLYNDFTKPIDATPFEARVGDTRLAPAEGGAYLTGTIAPPSHYPAEVGVDVHFPGAHEDQAHFDFVFVGEKTAEAAAAPPGRGEFRIPDSADGIFRAIMDRDAWIRELIDEGTWPDLYIPALEAKDLVLALAEKEPERVALPAKKLVRAAWLLDTYGDLGNREQVESAYRLFEEAIRELQNVRAN